MHIIKKYAPTFVYLVTLFSVLAAMGFTGLYLAVGPGLPDVDSIRQIRIQTPMSVYSKDGQLINEFGDIRRIPITLDQVPQDFINALLSTEDVRFYQHSGVDFKGVARAVVHLLTTGTKGQGASTITMLVARNYFLSREKRFSRKFTEMFVAWKLESELSKNEILEIFLNKIEFGHRTRGIGAAAEVYYGKPLSELSLAQLATLAGIPKGQSIYNPISRPDRALKRRTHVLGRMLKEQVITQGQYDSAKNAPIKTTRHGAKTTVSAPYLAEMVHMDMIRRFGRDTAHSGGLKVYTSLEPGLQSAAQKALRVSLMEYDRRHGYREVEQHYEIDENTTQQDRLAWISDFSQIGNLIPALVIESQTEQASILLSDGTIGIIKLKDSLWAKKYIDENHRDSQKLTEMTQIIQTGDVIRVEATDQFEIMAVIDDNSAETIQTATHEAPNETTNIDSKDTEKVEGALSPSPRAIYRLSQIPDANAGFVVLNPQNGAIEALVGGFDFNKNQFNMVTQARRQLGSNIKPFIYSSALNKGMTAATLINDSPIIDWDSSAGVYWRPENDSKIYRGPMRLRYALRWSVNTVSVRLIRKIGPAYAKKYLEKIGFPGQHMRPFQSLALGSASFTPLEVATGYAVLANGGYKIVPWYIDRIEDSHGKILFQQEPVQVCEKCIKILEQQEKEKQLALEAATESELDTQTEQTQLTDNQSSSGDQIPQKNSPPRLTDEEQALADQQSQINNWPLDAEKPLVNLPLLPVAKDKIAPRVIDERNRYIINDMLKDVIHRGTAWRTLNNAKSPLLKRDDLAGKTGTTNEYKDAWFSGYNSQHVASAWVGFVDHSKKLGKREFGARAALPIWRRFMEHALKGSPQVTLPRPDGIVEVKIDLNNGKLAGANTQKADFEVFRIENAPTEYSEPPAENILDHLDDTSNPETEQADEEEELF
ncbi:MAG: transglycosylase domain-containing protein [Enterobacterales bacterium]|nr:transglycosylase domain-containing protein [Enterobacterales bacterium]